MNSPNERGWNLTKREWEVLKLLANGLPLKELADKLGIALHTANRHLQHIYRKVQAKNRIDAVRCYQRRVRRQGGS